MGKAHLNYSITGKRLWGSDGAHSISLTAVSGGRAGSTTPGAVDPSVANNLFKMGQKESGKVHGGPLPIGRYQVGTPAKNNFGGGHKVYSAKLTPVSGGLTLGMMGRSGFYIHGSGPHGSEGCIVPTPAAGFHKVMKLLTESSGGELTVWP